MALQIWLPLTKEGDFTNRGLANASITNVGTAYNASGKLGGAVQFSQAKYLKINDYASTFATFSEYSLSVWFKSTAVNSQHTGSALISCGNWNSPSNLLMLSLSKNSSGNFDKLLVTGANGWYNGYSYNFALDTWYNVILTSGDGKTRAYVNGTLIGESYAAFVPSSFEQNWIAIGNGTYSQVFSFNGLMNDVRIYDHCLSIKEIKEINKGLMLHYSLNAIPSNEIICDHSGYNHDGTYTGSLTLDSTTGRYDYSTKFNSAQILREGFPTAQTYSFWAKYPSLPTGYDIIFTDGKSRVIFAYGGTSIGFCTSSTSHVSYNPGTMTQWNHYCIVNKELYINGVKATTKSQDSWSVSSTYLSLGQRHGGGAYPTIASVSDFRVYATALSEQDVKELYDTSGIIDNHNNLLSYSFKESDSNQLTKTGIFNSVGLFENDYIISYGGATWLKVLQHVNPSSNQFTSSNAGNNDSENLYSKLSYLTTNNFKSSNGAYEFLARQQQTSSGAVSTYRWTQTSAPASASSITGFTSLEGGLTRGLCKCSGNTYLAHTGTTGDWWGACGSWSTYQGGVPGLGNLLVTTGFIQLYVRIDNSNWPKSLINSINSNVKMGQFGTNVNDLIEI